VGVCGLCGVVQVTSGWWCVALPATAPAFFFGFLGSFFYKCLLSGSWRSSARSMCGFDLGLGVVSRGAQRQSSSKFRVSVSIGRRFDVLRARTGRQGPPTVMVRVILQCLPPDSILFDPVRLSPSICFSDSGVLIMDEEFVVQACL
jgi:hypothetical protein